MIEYCIVECYCTCIIEILSYFFILQSLTTSRMRNFQAIKLSQLHKAKTCWTENCWSAEWWYLVSYVKVAYSESSLLFIKTCQNSLEACLETLIEILNWIGTYKMTNFQNKYSVFNRILLIKTMKVPQCAMHLLRSMA